MLGSELWGDAGFSKEPSQDCHSDISLCHLLYAVRSLVRMSYAVCLLTVPAHLFQVISVLLACTVDCNNRYIIVDTLYFDWKYSYENSDTLKY